MATTMVQVRVDERTKESALKALAGMGLSVSDAVRMILVRVADQSEDKRHNSAEALFNELWI